MTLQSSEDFEKQIKENKTVIKISNEDTLEHEQFTFVQNCSTVENQQRENQGMEALIEDVWSIKTDDFEPVNDGRTTLHGRDCVD